MKLSPIVAALRARCPTLENRVGAAAQWAAVRESTNPILPAAFVIPLSEQADEQAAQAGFYQEIECAFAVLIVVSICEDESGAQAVEALDDLQREVFRAILGWRPGDDVDRVQYEGGTLIQLDRSRLVYQLDFKYGAALDRSDSWIPERDDRMDMFSRLGIDVDFIDPSPIGRPDGKIEHHLDIELSTTPD